MIWPRRQNTHMPVLPPVTLDGETVTLRPPSIDDYTHWHNVRSRNRAFLKPFEPTWPDDCLSRAFFERRLKRQTQDWNKDRGYSFLIFKKKDHALIGGININNVSRGAAQYATLGYWLDRDEQGKGYMSQSLRLVIDYGFNALDLHRFNAGCLKDNERSAKLLLNLGFEEEGFAKKFVQIDGKWQDHRLFGLPVEHWILNASK